MAGTEKLDEAFDRFERALRQFEGAVGRTQQTEKRAETLAGEAVVPAEGMVLPETYLHERGTARAVLAELYGRGPYHIREGGSVPVCEVFQRHLGAYSVMFGFGLHDEHFHAPNEFFRLSSLDRGMVAHGRLLEKLGQG